MKLNKFTNTGYKKDSPDRNNPYNIIPSGRITMKDVPYPVYGIDELGNSMYMEPGEEYQFPGSQVFEIPVHMMPNGTIMSNSEHPGYEMQYGGQNKADSLDVYNTGKMAFDIWNKGIPRSDINKSKQYSDAYYKYQKAISKFGIYNAELEDHKGYKPKINKPKPIVENKPFMDSVKSDGPDPRNIKQNTIENKTIIDYKQTWDPINKKWIQEPVYQTIPRQQYGGQIQELDDNEILSLREQGYIVEEL